MKAIVKTRPEPGAEFKDMPMPKLQSDEMLIKVGATGICGSDKDIYEWGKSKHHLPLPVIMGHEFFGEVAELGSAVQGFKPGDLIAADCHLPCGDCYECRTGYAHLCMKRGILGHEKDGCFAEYIALPAAAAIKMPAGTKPEHGALMEPMGVVYHAAMHAPVSGKTVLITGLGTLGYIMSHAAKLLGATRVIVCSTNDEKLDKCLVEGADYRINSLKENVAAMTMKHTRGNGADIIFECSGHVPLLNMGLDAAAYGADLVMIGVPNEDLVIPQYFNRVGKKEIKIRGTFGRSFYNTWELMKDLLDTGKLDPSRYVGKVIGLEDFEEAFELAKTSMGRIIMKP